MSASRDVDAGMQVLSQASPSQLETLKEQLDKLGPAYNYDIEYLNNFLHFKVRPHLLTAGSACCNLTATLHIGTRSNYDIEYLNNLLFRVRFSRLATMFLQQNR